MVRYLNTRRLNNTFQKILKSIKGKTYEKMARSPQYPEMLKRCLLSSLLIMQGLLLGITTAYAFTTFHQQRTKQHNNLILAAKKKQKKKSSTANQQRSRPISGKGFGQQINKSSTITIADDAVEVEEHGNINHHTVQYINLIEWLKQNPTTYISPKFSVQPSTLGGYGGFVTSSLKCNELIFQIPRTCCVTYEDVLSDPDCGREFRALIKDKRIPSWGMILLAGWIAKEYLLGKEYEQYEATTKNIASSSMNNSDNVERRGIKHWAYLQSVPWKKGELDQNHVIFWSDDEVESLLKGSFAYEDAILIRKTVDDSINLLKDIVVPIIKTRTVLLCDDSKENFQSTTNEDDEDDTDDILNSLEEAVKGAFVIALSRSFAEEVELDDGSIEIENLLLPLIDILQHSNKPNTMLEPYEDYILVRARRDIDIGEELFHQYQEENDAVIPPHKFFTRYGFIPGVSESITELLRSRNSLFFE